MTGSLLAYRATWARIRERDIKERDNGEKNIGETVATCRFNQQLLIQIHI